MLEISGTGPATEERIAAIEKKMRDIEALVKGLTQELLDLKSVAMKMNKQTEERSRQELKRAQAVVQDAPAPASSTGWSVWVAPSSCAREHGHLTLLSPTGTYYGHDHAVRRDHENGTTARRQKLYRCIGRIRAK